MQIALLKIVDLKNACTHAKMSRKLTIATLCHSSKCKMFKTNLRRSACNVSFQYWDSTIASFSSLQSTYLPRVRKQKHDKSHIVISVICYSCIFFFSSSCSSRSGTVEIVIKNRINTSKLFRKNSCFYYFLFRTGAIHTINK